MRSNETEEGERDTLARDRRPTSSDCQQTFILPRRGPLLAASRGILAGLSWVVLLWTRAAWAWRWVMNGSGLPTCAGSATHIE